VLVTGDMNDTRRYYCPFVRATRMHAANGGRVTRGRCRLPDNPGIDWIFGTTDIRFTGYSEASGRLARRTSDHPMIWANAGLESPARRSQCGAPQSEPLRGAAEDERLDADER
jgi:hypothetical protein